MLTSTVKAIDILISLFTEEEQESLSITRNRTKITLLDQFIARWEKHRPKYSLEIFKVKAVLILEANHNLIYRVIEFSKEEFKQKMNEDLMKQENYVITKHVHYEGDNKNKKLNINQNDSISVLRLANKNRSGNTESGQEFIELDKVWDAEDNEFLNEGLNKKKIQASLQIDGTKDLMDGIEINLATEGETKTDFYIPPTKTVNSAELTEEEPTLHSITTTQTRQKNLNQTVASMFNFSNIKSDKKGDSTQTQFSLANNYNRIFAFKLRNLRELLFQHLDNLFVQECQ